MLDNKQSSSVLVDRVQWERIGDGRGNQETMMESKRARAGGCNITHGGALRDIYKYNSILRVPVKKGIPTTCPHPNLT